MASDLSNNLEQVRNRIDAAARQAGREPSDVDLVAVTKTVPPSLAGSLIALGHFDLGENRVDELERKVAWFDAHGLTARWHLIGSLQRNKARRAARLADVVHSVDRAELLETLNGVAGEEGRRIGIYLQVKLTNEPTKAGLAPDDVRPLVLAARACTHLELLGLMAMAPLPGESASQHDAQRTFDAAHALARSLEDDAETRAAFTDGRVRLSMGMSSDVEAAVRAGSTVVRVGTALYEGVDTGEEVVR